MPPATWPPDNYVTVLLEMDRHPKTPNRDTPSTSIRNGCIYGDTANWWRSQVRIATALDRDTGQHIHC